MTLASDLFDQAKKCQTSQGAALLLALKGHVEGGKEVIEGCTELWQAADVLMQPCAAGRAKSVLSLLAREIVEALVSDEEAMRKLGAAIAAAPLPSILEAR